MAWESQASQDMGRVGLDHTEIGQTTPNRHRSPGPILTQVGAVGHNQAEATEVDRGRPG